MKCDTLKISANNNGKCITDKVLPVFPISITATPSFHRSFFLLTGNDSEALMFFSTTAIFCKMTLIRCQRLCGASVQNGIARGNFREETKSNLQSDATTRCYLNYRCAAQAKKKLASVDCMVKSEMCIVCWPRMPCHSTNR